MKLVRRILFVGLTGLCFGTLVACSPSNYFEKPLVSSKKKAESMHLRINRTDVQIELEDNHTAETFQKILPETFTMRDLNQNEKYYELPQTLPNHEVRVGKIEAGDVMLYGNNTLVVFYQTFETSYSYTRIGRITDTDNLANRLGGDEVDVEISN